MRRSLHTKLALYPPWLHATKRGGGTKTAAPRPRAFPAMPHPSSLACAGSQRYFQCQSAATALDMGCQTHLVMVAHARHQVRHQTCAHRLAATRMAHLVLTIAPSMPERVEHHGCPSLRLRDAATSQRWCGGLLVTRGGGRRPAAAVVKCGAGLGVVADGRRCWRRVY